MSRQDIEQREQEWLKAFTAGDAAGVAAIYAEDARLLAPNIDVLEGRPAIEAFVKEFVAMGSESMSFDLITVHETPDLCVAVGRYELQIRPEGADVQRDSGKYVEVWARRPDGSWLMTDDIFNSSLPAPGA
jgi:uncharacterized protein (TIGR02246 family)